MEFKKLVSIILVLLLGTQLNAQCLYDGVGDYVGTEPITPGIVMDTVNIKFKHDSSVDMVRIFAGVSYGIINVQEFALSGKGEESFDLNYAIYGDEPVIYITVIGVDDATNDQCLDFLELEINLSSTLPVVMSKVEIQLDVHDVVLDWKTYLEIDNDGYEILRSNDLENWESIGWIDGNENSNEIIEYSYRDQSVPYEELHYRIKQIDNDGLAVLSEIVSVEHRLNPNAKLEFYPNPSNGIIYFDFPTEFVNELFVYNQLGTLVKVISNPTREVHLDELSSGVYVIHAKQTEAIFTIHKIVKR